MSPPTVITLLSCCNYYSREGCCKIITTLDLSCCVRMYIHFRTIWTLIARWICCRAAVVCQHCDNMNEKGSWKIGDYRMQNVCMSPVLRVLHAVLFHPDLFINPTFSSSEPWLLYLRWWFLKIPCGMAIPQNTFQGLSFLEGNYFSVSFSVKSSQAESSWVKL